MRSRVRDYAALRLGEGSLPEALAGAARTALDRVLASSGTRAVALDLLAADALVTLALLAEAERAPQRLDEFAASMLRTARPAA